MSIYLYQGTVSGVTLDDGTTVALHPNKKVVLPNTNPYVQALIAQGYLQLIEEKTNTPKAQTPENKPAKKG